MNGGSYEPLADVQKTGMEDAASRTTINESAPGALGIPGLMRSVGGGLSQ